MNSHPAFLYVEDDPLGREIMEIMLTSQGYTQFNIFEDSANFLPRVEALTSQPDIFLLDVHVGPCDGFEMLKMLRAHPTFSSRIVVAVTASVMNEEVARLRQAGFNGAIGKPLDYDNFATLMASIL